MEPKVYLDFLRRRWWLLILGPVIAGLAAFVVTKQMTPMYKATSTILVNRLPTNQGVIEYNDILTSERLTNTYAVLVERPPVLQEAINRLELPLTTRQLDAKISVSTIKDTQLLSLSATDPSPELAQKLANTTAQAFADDNAGQLAPAGTVTIAKQAEHPLSPVSPNLMLNVIFAIFLGSFAAAGIGLLLDYLDDTVKTPESIEAVAALPTLGLIGRFHTNAGPAFATELHSRSAEAYRQLRTNVHFATFGTKLKTIVITSSNPEEGKSTTAANLATVLAQAGDKVILVDTDLRRPSLQRIFQGQNSLGLTGLLLNDVQDPSLALVPTRWKNLRLLPAGMLPPNPSELLTSTRMLRVINALRDMADFVVFDTPPVLAVTDAIVMAARTDGTILVAEAGRTRSDALREAARTLEQANAHTIGVVLNRAKVRQTGDYYYRSDEAAVEIEPDAPRPVISAPQPRPAEPVIASTRSVGDDVDQFVRDQSLRRAQEALAAFDALAIAAPSGNGHTTGNGHTNGNGNGRTNGREHSDPSLEMPHLTEAVGELLLHLDDTVGLIRSLKPGTRDPGV